MENRRFVILRHEPGPAGPRQLHWDLMLECGDSLRVWALDREPQVGIEMMADQLPKHRLDYLDYEGPVSRGRGTVRQFDRGTYEIFEDSPQHLAIRLHGERLVGCLRLTCDPTTQRWSVLLMFN